MRQGEIAANKALYVLRFEPERAGWRRDASGC